MTIDSLPLLDPRAAALSDRLVSKIRAEIDANLGWLGFDRYMEMVLYEPGLGYYSAGSAKLGPQGDFVTAPEISDIFGRVLAGELLRVLATLERPVVLELGAGTGRLARTLLDAFSEADVNLHEYWILELSAELKDRQRRCLESHAGRVRWLNALPDASFEGIVLANEVADALPVSVFVKRGARALPLGVRWDGDAFVWAAGPAEPLLSTAVVALEQRLGRELPDGYRSELCLRLPPWLASLSAPVRRGAILLIDYGLGRQEYYHPDRSQGTLICHHRHRAHADPFLFPGLQDVSAWVDFSACAEAGLAAGFAVAGYTTQGQFLLHGGAAEMLEGLTGRERLHQSQALKTLILPGEMGERFKLLLLSRGIGADLPGRDFRDRL